MNDLWNRLYKFRIVKYDDEKLIVECEKLIVRNFDELIVENWQLIFENEKLVVENEKLIDESFEKLSGDVTDRFDEVSENKLIADDEKMNIENVNVKNLNEKIVVKNKSLIAENFKNEINVEVNFEDVIVVNLTMKNCCFKYMIVEDVRLW